MSHPSCYGNKASAANCLLYNNTFEHPTQVDATIYTQFHGRTYTIVSVMGASLSEL